VNIDRRFQSGLKKIVGHKIRWYLMAVLKYFQSFCCSKIVKMQKHFWRAISHRTTRYVLSYMWILQLKCCETDIYVESETDSISRGNLLLLLDTADGSGHRRATPCTRSSAPQQQCCKVTAEWLHSKCTLLFQTTVKATVTTTIRLRFDAVQLPYNCSSTALRSFDDIRSDLRP